MASTPSYVEPGQAPSAGPRTVVSHSVVSATVQRRGRFRHPGPAEPQTSVHDRSCSQHFERWRGPRRSRRPGPGSPGLPRGRPAGPRPAGRATGGRNRTERSTSATSLVRGLWGRSRANRPSGRNRPVSGRDAPMRRCCSGVGMLAILTLGGKAVTVSTCPGSCFLLMGDHPSGLFPRRSSSRHDVRSRGIRPVPGG